MVQVLPVALVASREVQLAELRELLAVEHDRPQPERGALGALVLDALPAVEAEVQAERGAILDRERPAVRQSLDRHLIAPVPDTRPAARAARITLEPRDRTSDRAMPEVPLEAIQPLGRSSPFARNEQLQEFGVRPQKRHGGAGGPAGGESELRDGGGIPNLLGQQSAGARAAPHRLQIRQRILAALQREMPALADEQWPAAADALPVERTAVGVLAIAVAVVAVIERAGRGLDLEDMIDHANRILHARVEGVAQPEPYQVREIQAHERGGVQALAVAIAQLHRRGALAPTIRRSDAHVVARHPDLAGKRGPFDVAPALEPLVPILGEREHVGPLCGLEPWGSGDEGGNRHGQGESAHSGVLFPAILG